MFAEPAGTVTLRAASTKLPSLNRHTGRPLAKLRKCVPSALGDPFALKSIASGSVKSHVPFAWHAYFWTPVACNSRNTLLAGSYVRGSSGSPGTVGAGFAAAAAATSAQRTRTPAH